MPRGNLISEGPTGGGGFAELTSLTGIDASNAPGVTTTPGVTNTADVRGMLVAAIEVNNLDDVGAVFTVEGALRETGVWVPIAWRLSAVAADAYTKTARTTPAATAELLFLSDTDYVNFIRVNVSTISAPGVSFVVGASR